MEYSAPAQVVSLIRASVLRIRTALWLLPPALIGQERNEAARLLVEAIDLRQVYLNKLPPNTPYLGLTGQKLIELIEDIVEEEGRSNCVLIYNLDLLLSRLSQPDIYFFWHHVFQSMPHRSRALLLSIPASAGDLLPPEDLRFQLSREKRISNTTT